MEVAMNESEKRVLKMIVNQMIEEIKLGEWDEAILEEIGDWESLEDWEIRSMKKFVIREFKAFLKK
jgi:hypothetical protein